MTRPLAPVQPSRRHLRSQDQKRCKPSRRPLDETVGASDLCHSLDSLVVIRAQVVLKHSGLLFLGERELIAHSGGGQRRRDLVCATACREPSFMVTRAWPSFDGYVVMRGER